jgi:hypothetical protein
MGVVSATMLAPLIARWNDLRLSERAAQLGKDVGKQADVQARDLSRFAAERARELSELATDRSQQWAELARARSNEWRDLVADRAGDWGIVAAGRARALGDQAVALSDDLLALASSRADDLRKQAALRLEDARQQFLETKAYDALKGAIPAMAKLDNRKARRRTTMLWVVGALVGLAAGAGAFLYIRARLRAPTAEPLVELPQGGTARTGAQSTGRGPAAAVSGALSGLRAAAERRGIQSMRDIDSPKDANAAPIVGNIHTMVYHDASDQNLPSEENRVYFANEAEARARGFRSARPTAVEHNER